MEKRKQEVLDTINKMIELSEPIYYEDINKFYNTLDKDKLFSAEKDMLKLGIASHFMRDKNGKLIISYDNVGISTFSIIATITDCLCDSRLSFMIEDSGLMTGVCWYKEREDNT
jgi:hypothetical protein